MGRKLTVALVLGVLATPILAVACFPDVAVAELVPDFPDSAPRACGDGFIKALPDGGGETCDPGDTVEAGLVLGCVDCHVTCDGTLSDAGTNHCYFVSAAGDLSNVDAIVQCRKQNAHVVTLADPDEVAIAESLAAGRSYWVGLNYEDLHLGYTTEKTGVPAVSTLNFEPGWPLPPSSGPCPGCFGFGHDGGGFDLPSGPPFDGGSPPAGVSCVAAIGGGWFAADCQTPRTTICEREPVGSRRDTSCTGGFCFTVAPTIATKSYFLGTSEDTFANAQAICANATGGKLAVFSTREERAAVVSEVFAFYKDFANGDVTFWIGLHSDASGNWSWEDDAGDGQHPLVWGDQQPSPVSAPRSAFVRMNVLYDTGLVHVATSVDERRPYLCERSPSP